MDKIKDFLEMLAYIVAVIVGIEEIIKNHKRKG